MENITIQRLPFYWRVVTALEKSDPIVATHYPFIFDFNNDIGLVIQKRDPLVLHALDTIYQQEHNIGYLQDANEIARPYGQDFIGYLNKALEDNKHIQSILEIGCGGCVVLADIKKRGYKVYGIDSSPFAATEGAKKGVDVLTEFFPSPKLQEKFDLIYHVDVLEHISDPVKFLKHQYQGLNENGLVIVNVPDATESIEIGDISMAMHQHLNYFTEKSLGRALEAAGFDIVTVDRAGYGGSLYAIGRRSNNPSATTTPPLQQEVLDYTTFVNKASQAITAFKVLTHQITSNPENSLGYYVPLRTLPYLAATNITPEHLAMYTKNTFRFFDDTENWYQREFDGVNVKIENFSDLKNNPVSHIIIMSLTFGEVIKRKIVAEFGNKITIYTLSEIIRSASR